MMVLPSTGVVMTELILRRALSFRLIWPAWSAKRALELLLIAMLAPLWGPLLVGLMLAVGRAPFYAQDRVGLHGRLFRMWKLRSMRPGAEGQLAVLLSDPLRRREWIRHGKLARDPRITPLGQWLRRHSLDELPQIWNVIRGDMALVGPRPLLPGEIAREYGAAAARVVSVRPGMTGSWQVSGGMNGRNSLSYAERLRLDLAYARGSTLRSDLMILLRTVGAILRGSGR